MRLRKWTTFVLILTCTTMMSWGCGGNPTGPTGSGKGSGNGNNGGGNNGGGVPPPATNGVLRVTVDRGCSSADANVQVYVDSIFLGVAQPGDSGLTKTVSLGDHSVRASGQRGTQWGPTSVTVGSSGYNLNLTCNSTTNPPPATTATLRVQVDANCTGIAANVQVSIDGVLAGTTQPGSTGVSKVVSIGNHTIFGLASNGTTWPTFTVAVPANGFISNLTCR